MIPILFPKDATVSSGIFQTNGIGRLTGALEAYVTEERNGEYELEMRISAESAFANFIEIGCYIGVTSFKNSGRQLFEVYEIEKSIDGEIDVYAKHVSYRASFTPIRAFKLNGATLSSVTNTFGIYAFEPSQYVFDFWVDPEITKTANYDGKVPKSLKKCLSDEEGGLLSVFNDTDVEIPKENRLDLEYEWDNYTIKIHKNRGTKSGAELRRGKNITSLEASNSDLNLVTGIMPYWCKSDGTDMIIGSSVTLSPTAADYPYHRTMVLNCSADFKKKPTTSQLAEKAKKYFKDEIIKLEQSIKVSYVDLRKSLDYNNLAPFEDIRLCDTIVVKYPQVGINYEAKVTKLKWNVLTESNEEIEVGEPSEGLSTSIGKAIDYMDISGLVDAQENQDVVINEQMERIEGNEDSIEGLDVSLTDLSHEVEQHDVTIGHVNTFFKFGNDGLTISTDATSIKTVYTANGFYIQDKNGLILAEATADEFNCVNGLGIDEWHFDIDEEVVSGQPNKSTLTLYRKLRG